MTEYLDTDRWDKVILAILSMEEVRHLCLLFVIFKFGENISNKKNYNIKQYIQNKYKINNKHIQKSRPAGQTSPYIFPHWPFV